MKSNELNPKKESYLAYQTVWRTNISQELAYPNKIALYGIIFVIQIPILQL